MKRHWQYLKYVTRHKWYVFLACLRLRVPLWIALFHDWDKFMPDEWFPYARTFYAPDGSKRYVESVDFAHAWMKHQHRNKHHWQYWLWITIADHNFGMPIREGNYLVWDRGEAQQIVERGDPETRLELRPVPPYYPLDADPMPDVYRREMLADWMGAGKALGKPLVWEWYEANKDKIKLHADTRAWVETELAKLKESHRLDMKGIAMGFVGRTWWDA